MFCTDIRTGPLQPVKAFADERRAFAHLLFGDGQRRRDAEGRVAVEEPVAQDARLLEELHDPVKLRRVAQLDGQQQPRTADLPHGGMVREQLLVEGALRLDALDDAVFEQVVQCRKPRGAADRMAAEGGDVPQRRIVLQGIHDLVPRDESPEGHAPAEGLGQANDVGRDAVA